MVDMYYTVSLNLIGEDFLTTVKEISLKEKGFWLLQRDHASGSVVCTSETGSGSIFS